MSKRLAKFAVAPEMLALIGQGVYRVVDNPLPADAELRAAFYDEDRHCFVVVLESKAFRPVPNGDVAPFVEAPVIEALRFAP